MSSICGAIQTSHDLLLGPESGHDAFCAILRAAIAGYRFSGAGECKQYARNRRDHSARSDQPWRNAGAEDFRVRIRIERDAPARAARFAFPPAGRADGVAEVLRVVRQQAAAGVDVIKM